MARIFRERERENEGNILGAVQGDCGPLRSRPAEYNDGLLLSNFRLKIRLSARCFVVVSRKIYGLLYGVNTRAAG